MKDLNEDGATAVPAAVAPWAMKHILGHSCTHWQNSSNGKKITGQSPPNKLHIIALVGNLRKSKSAASNKRKPTHEVV